MDGRLAYLHGESPSRSHFRFAFLQLKQGIPALYVPSCQSRVFALIRLFSGGLETGCASEPVQDGLHLADN